MHHPSVESPDPSFSLGGGISRVFPDAPGPER